MGSIKDFIENIMNRGKKKTTAKPSVIKQTYSYIYKGESVWDSAAKEYRHLKGMSEDTELTEEEKAKIYDYTMMPFSYFFGWLCERDLIGEGFVNEFGEAEAAAYLDQIKTCKTTPLKMLAGFGHYFTYEWIRDEAKYFFRCYVDVRDRYKDEDTYLYDYFECNWEPEDRYYCVEYSDEVQKRINKRLDERYAECKTNDPQAYRNIDFYEDEEDDEHVVSIHSGFFDTDLDVFRSGRIRKGEFPEDYALKCLKSLEQMTQKEWNRMEQSLAEIYHEEAEMLKIDHFHAVSVYIYEPQEEGDLAFAISGEADYEEEHGISFTVRNGIILDWSYALEFSDPYEKEMIKKYELYLKGEDISKIKEQNDLEILVKEGKMVRTLLVPEWLGGEDTDENTIFVTPEALIQIEKIHKRLKAIKAYAASNIFNWEFKVDIIPTYCEQADGTKSPVPMWISYTTPWQEKAISINLRADVWWE